MMSQTGVMTFFFLSIIIRQLYISLNHFPKATHDFKNACKS